MTGKKPRRKRAPVKCRATPKRPKAWYLDFAYELGKTANTVHRKVGSAVTVIEKKLDETGKTLERGLKQKGKARRAVRTGRVKVLPRTAQESLSPILKEMKAIADISGLTAAVMEMNEISLRHSSHPVVNRIFARIKQLSREEQESLSRKFIERLSANDYLNQVLRLGPAKQMTEEDCRKMSDAFIECMTQTLGDAGVARAEQELLQKLSDEVLQPLHNLIQFYLKPKTLSQKIKRLWKMQRILIKTIKLMRLAETVTLPRAEGPLYGRRFEPAGVIGSSVKG